jgi:hypothetical protein
VIYLAYLAHNCYLFLFWGILHSSIFSIYLSKHLMFIASHLSLSTIA